jgi:cystathionine beta-synthase
MNGAASGSASAGVRGSVLDLIGATPMVRLGRLQGARRADILAKLEWFNPGGSVKDRAGLAMIEAAEAQGLLKPGATLVEATFGNTGIGLAIAARLKGYRLVATMPDRVSPDKVNLLKAYGAKVILTPSDLPEDDPGHYRNLAKRIADETPGSFLPNQYFNEANPRVHYETTGPEIWRQTGGKVDVLVAGLGTGGTLTGAGRYLKEMNPSLKLVGVDPKGSRYQAAFAGGEAAPRPYLVEGIGQDFLPGTLDLKLLDHVLTVDDAEAFAMARRLALEEGLLAGGSSGAAVTAALRIAADWAAGLSIAVILPDDGRNYLSRIYSDEWMRDQGFLDGGRREAPVPVADLLARKPVRLGRLHILHPDDRARQAITAMMTLDISQLPVLSGRVQVGSVTKQGIAERLAEYEAAGRGTSASFGDLKVSEVMGLPLPVLQRAAALPAPLGYFRENPAVLVVDGDEPVGILTYSDAVHYQLRG